jgi:ABC-2 type transport system ATP-binding protein
MSISAHEGGLLLPALLEDFEHYSIPVSSVSIRSPSLEDVFIYLTGRELDESAGTGPLTPPGGTG